MILTGDTQHAGKTLINELKAKAMKHLVDVHADKTKAKLASALKQFVAFTKAVPGRRLFVQPNALNLMKVTRRNEWTLILFAEWLAVQISPKTKKPIQAKSIVGYVGMVRAHYGRTLGFDVAKGGKRLPSVLKAMVRGDPRAQQKRRRQGLRGTHLRNESLRGE